jgi:hypothetical protein
MYCDRCGTPFGAGVIYCASCGKQLMAAPVAPAAGYAAPAQGANEGRVRRNINLVAGFWLANGILRLMSLGWMMVFHRLIFPGGWVGDGRWPFGGPINFGPWIWGGMFSAGIFLAMFGVVHILLAWGLYERQPWARVLGIVVGFLALIRIPFGTALGIYTIWVLLPERSAREYDAMAGVGGPVNAARYSA